MTRRSSQWDRAKNLLAVRLDTVGDVLMTTPAISALTAPGGRRVTLLTSRPGAAIAQLVPQLSGVVEWDVPWMRASGGRADPAGDRAMVERLRAASFDAAVIFTAYSQPSLPAALICWLADIPLRLAHSRDKPYGLLTDWVRETEPERGVRHEVRRQLDLVATVGATTADARLSLAVPAAARAAVRARLDALGIGPDGRWLVLHPGAAAASRRYPAEAFSAAARRFAEEDGARVIVTGDADERELAASIASAVPGAVSLAGQLSLAELCGLIAQAPLLVSNNTGPAHIGAAVGTPVVVVYALTNPQHAPWRVAHRLLFHDVSCRWCHSSVCVSGHHDCVRLVEPGALVNSGRMIATGWG
jgi:lipopolysaccharide heptosyltransferase II